MAHDGESLSTDRAAAKRVRAPAEMVEPSSANGRMDSAALLTEIERLRAEQEGLARNYGLQVEALRRTRALLERLRAQNAAYRELAEAVAQLTHVSKIADPTTDPLTWPIVPIISKARALLASDSTAEVTGERR